MHADRGRYGGLTLTRSVRRTPGREGGREMPCKSRGDHVQFHASFTLITQRSTLDGELSNGGTK
jgi:hypothetical protein